MKKIFNPTLVLLCVIGALFAASCTDNDDERKTFPEITQPFESVTALDGKTTATAIVSDEDKTIKFDQFKELTDISAVSVSIKMANGALLKTPAHATEVLNLTSPYKIVLHNGKKEITYTLTAKAKEIPMPVIDATTNGVKAEISGSTITITYKSTMNINAMPFTFNMEAGAVISSPKTTTYDLEYSDGTLVVSYMGREYTYTIKVKEYVDPLLSKGWKDITANYGTLPKYIKVYKNEDLLNNAVTKSIGYIAIMGPKATLGAVGSGTADKNIYALAKEAPEWNVLLVGISSAPGQTIVRNGAFVKNPDAGKSYGTIGQSSDGRYKMAWTMKFDEQLYAFPFREGSTYTDRQKSEGTVWNATTAISGIPMILWEGNVLTAGQTLCNDGGNNNWYDGSPRYARSAVGITATGKIYAFCGQQVGGSVGLSMLELAGVMKDCGCVSAINFEGSGTPNMLINGKDTAMNSKVYNADGTKITDGENKAKSVQVAVAFK